MELKSTSSESDIFIIPTAIFKTLFTAILFKNQD